VNNSPSTEPLPSLEASIADLETNKKILSNIRVANQALPKLLKKVLEKCIGWTKRTLQVSYLNNIQYIIINYVTQTTKYFYQSNIILFRMKVVLKKFQDLWKLRLQFCCKNLFQLSQMLSQMKALIHIVIKI
jgi:hypothetical protein